MYASPPFALTAGRSQKFWESLALSKSLITSGTLSLSPLTITGCAAAVFMILFVCMVLFRTFYFHFFSTEFLTNDVLDTHVLARLGPRIVHHGPAGYIYARARFGDRMFAF